MSIPGPGTTWPPKLLVDGNQVNTTAISDDGKVLLTGTSKEYGTPAERSVFCLDASGNIVWKDTLTEKLDDGVYWVAVSGDGKYGVAGGGCFTKTGETTKYGFLKAYDMSLKTGNVLLDTTFKGRVNQTVMCKDGLFFAAVVEDTVRIGQLQEGKYTLETKVFSGDYLMSVDMAKANGQTIIACGENNDYGGVLYMLNYIDGAWKHTGPWTNYEKILRVAVTPDGKYWAASSGDGYIYFFFWKTFVKTLQPVWKFKPSSPDLGTAYGLAIAKDGDGNMVIGAGANNESKKGTGYVYILKFPPDATSAPKNIYFGAPLQHDPNPGLHFDAAAQYMTATDGEPTGGSTESKGNFYLFDVPNKKQLWIKNTSIMNWPMAINATGTAIFGGSDDGRVYYWGAPT